MISTPVDRAEWSLAQDMAEITGESAMDLYLVIRETMGDDA